MSEFNWWLLIVGLVLGAGLVWLILADSNRRESEIADAELPAEAAWIAATLQESGEPIDAETTQRVLRLHRAYLASLPPDEPDPDRDDAAHVDTETGAVTTHDVAPARTDGESRPDTAQRSGTTPVWSATEPSPRRR